MKVGKYAMILGVWLSAAPVLAQDSETDPNASGSSGAGSVTGMFAGMNVGGSRRRVPHEARTTHRKKGDSFAVSPSDYAKQTDSSNQNRVQTRQIMVPGVETRTRTFPPVPVEAPATQEAKEVEAQSVTETVENAQSLSTQTANPSAENYYNNLIDQVRGKSDQANGLAPAKSKFVVTNENKF